MDGNIALGRVVLRTPRCFRFQRVDALTAEVAVAMVAERAGAVLQVAP